MLVLECISKDKYKFPVPLSHNNASASKNRQYNQLYPRVKYTYHNKTVVRTKKNENKN